MADGGSTTIQVDGLVQELRARIGLFGFATMATARAIDGEALKAFSDFRQDGRFADPAHFLERWKERETFIRLFGFSIPCADAVQAICSMGPLVEVGCGSGYWSAILRCAGADIVATDLVEPGVATGYGFEIGRFAFDQAVSGEAVPERWPDRDLFVSWLPYEHASDRGQVWQALMLDRMRPGNRIAVIGEGEGGCTGSEAFHRLLDAEFDLLGRWRIPHFPCIHDDLRIFKKRGADHG